MSFVVVGNPDNAGDLDVVSGGDDNKVGFYLLSLNEQQEVLQKHVGTHLA
jgi:hypothetical protein